VTARGNATYIAVELDLLLVTITIVLLALALVIKLDIHNLVPLGSERGRLVGSGGSGSNTAGNHQGGKTGAEGAKRHG